MLYISTFSLRFTIKKLFLSTCPLVHFLTFSVKRVGVPSKQKQALHGLVGEALKFKEFYASERSSLSTHNPKKPPPIGEGLVFYPRSLFLAEGLRVEAVNVCP